MLSDTGLCIQRIKIAWRRVQSYKIGRMAAWKPKWQLDGCRQGGHNSVGNAALGMTVLFGAGEVSCL